MNTLKVVNTPMRTYMREHVILLTDIQTPLVIRVVYTVQKDMLDTPIATEKCVYGVDAHSGYLIIDESASQASRRRLFTPYARQMPARACKALDPLSKQHPIVPTTTQSIV
jgi:hypothetical protein